MNQDDKYMRLALKEANKAFRKGEVPIGAVIINKNGDILSKAHNKIEALNDPTAHAELLAIRKAAKKNNNWRLEGTTLYCTKEPCIMCAGGMIQARIKRIVFSTEDEKSGAAGSLYNVLIDRRLNHRVIVQSGVLKDNSCRLLKEFFVSVRGEQKKKLRS